MKEKTIHPRACRGGKLRRALCLLLAALAAIGPLSLPAFAQEEGVLVTGRFDSAAYPGELSYQFPYRDGFFSGPGTEYCHELAQCTLGMAVSAFRSADQQLDKKDENIRDYLAQAGFSDMDSQEFNEKPTAKTIATLIASKTLVDEEGEFLLVAAAVSGGGYQDEWLSNFSFGDEVVHHGFFSAGFTVFQRVFDYIDARAKGKRFKIWMGGYSRAAAVSNMAAVLMLSAEQVAPEDLYVYTFATPNNAQAERLEVDMDCDYSSIFNIVGMFDPVPGIPFSEWDYSKLGTTFRLPAKETTPDYESRCVPVREVYREITGGEYASSPECNWFLQKLYQLLYDMIGTAGNYQAQVEQVIDSAWENNSSTYRLLREICRILSENQAVDDMLLGETLTADTLLSVFLFDFLEENLGVHENGMGKLALFSQLFYEHCPEVYVSWMMSQSDEEKLFVSDTGYRRVFLDGDIEVTARSSSGQVLEQVCSVNLGNTRMVTLPAGEAYELRLAADGGKPGTVKVVEYQAGSLRYVYRLYRVAGTGEYLLSLPASAQPYALENVSLTDCLTGFSVEPKESALDQKVVPPSAVFELEDSGWLASHFLETVLIGAAVLVLLLLALLVWLVVRAVRRRKRKRAERRSVGKE